MEVFGYQGIIVSELDNRTKIRSVIEVIRLSSFRLSKWQKPHFDNGTFGGTTVSDFCN